MAAGPGRAEVAVDVRWARAGYRERPAARSLARGPDSALHRLGERRLATRAAAGDEAAFGELYRRHHQALFRYGMALLRDPRKPPTCFRPRWPKALAALEAGEEVDGVRPWLFRIARNTAIDNLRRRRPQAALEDLTEVESSAVTAPSAASEAESRAELAETVADIRELPERQGHALVMREVSVLSYADIALVLSTSQAAARQLVHQARSVLHDRRSGRDMGCEAVRRAISERDGKAPCDRRLRAHLATCPDCRGFRASIDRRRSALAALAAPLAPAVAGDILGRLLDQGSGSGTSLAAGGGAAGGLAKLAGASSGAKLAARRRPGRSRWPREAGCSRPRGVLEGRDGARGAPAVPSSLAEMPEFRALRPAHRRGGEVRDGRDGASPAPTAPAEDLGPLAAFPAEGGGPLARPTGVDEPDGRGPERPGCLRPVG